MGNFQGIVFELLLSIQFTTLRSKMKTYTITTYPPPPLELLTSRDSSHRPIRLVESGIQEYAENIIPRPGASGSLDVTPNTPANRTTLSHCVGVTDNSGNYF